MTTDVDLSGTVDGIIRHLPSEFSRGPKTAQTGQTIEVFLDHPDGERSTLRVTDTGRGVEVRWKDLPAGQIQYEATFQGQTSKDWFATVTASATAIENLV